MKKEVVHRVEITPKNFITLLLMVVGVWFFMNLYELVFAVFLAFIIAAFFTPAFNWLQSKGVGRIVALLFIYLVSLGIIGALIFFASQPLVSEFKNLGNFLKENFPILGEFIVLNGNGDPVSAIFSLQTIRDFLPGISSAVGVIGQTSWTLLLVITTIVISAYMLIYKDSFSSNLRVYLPKHMQDDFVILMQRIEKNLGAWMNGQLILGVIIGVLSYLGMTLFGVKFALTLGLLGGLLEVVPSVGPIVFGAVSILVAFADGKPLWVLAGLALWNFFVQQFEGAFIVPKVMQRVVGINPIIVILSIISGLKLFGVLGGLLAVPVIVIINIILEYRLEKQRNIGKT